MSVVLISGASGAIGGACARIFTENGHNVIAHYFKNKEKAESLCRELNEKRRGAAYPLYADLTKESDVSELFQKAHEEYPVLDALICCAGAEFYALNDNTSVGDWDRVFDVNAKSVFLCCREALKYMLPRKKGRIVTVSSVWGITGAAAETAYSAAKGAVIAYTKALAKEAGPSGISVNCLAPGAIKSAMLDPFSRSEINDLAAEAALMKIGEPIDAARAAYFLASDAAEYLTGQVLSPNGGSLI